MFRINSQFPSCANPAVLADGSIDDNFSITEYGAGEYTVVFFYPLDFTFVCPTEIVAFDKATEAFSARDCKVVGVSVDSQFSHLAWRKTDLKDGGIGPVSFPLVSDLQRNLSGELGILNEGGVTYRASYLLDKEGKVRHAVINDLPLGRSVQEMLRMVDALRFHENHGQVCPANWCEGKEAIQANAESTGAYLAKQEESSSSAA